MILHTHALIGEILAFRLAKKQFCYVPAGPRSMKKRPNDQPDGDLSYRPDFARIIAKGLY